MRRIAFLFFFFTFFFSGFAQEQPLERHLLKLNVLIPGLTYELGLAENISLNFDALLRFPLHIEYTYYSNHVEEEVYLFGVMSGNLTMQYYFNRNKRGERGRSLYNNSGMFIGPSLQLWSRDLFSTTSKYFIASGIAVGAVWGIQRTFNNNLNFTFMIGPAISSTSEDPILPALISKFTFGYVFFSKGDRSYKKPLPEFSPDEY